MKVFLQKNRSKPGLVLPAEAQKQINDHGEASFVDPAAPTRNVTPVVPDHVLDPSPLVTSQPKRFSDAPDGVIQQNLRALRGQTATEVVEDTEPVDEPVDPPGDEPTAEDLAGEEDPGVDETAPETDEEPEADEPVAEVVEAVVDAPAEEPEAEPEAVLSDERDDLTVINGIGSATQKELNRAGIYTFEQLAQADVAMVNELPRVADRADEWVREAMERSAAKALANQPSLFDG